MYAAEPDALPDGSHRPDRFVQSNPSWQKVKGVDGEDYATGADGSEPGRVEAGVEAVAEDGP